ncbi:MAG: dimethyl sulfoxide reductase anchor subunit [Rhodospirillaceae bacterium]|nr:dimethyl sulfoxide reductase anchor subunit [Rhodospirillaceae bacterium]MBL6931268.1 dimethyl sulfoxide reductase anchor subunit [Rhodospirillales bacterium]MBL6942502.1 dimethyl sulfoxide reductase anchor subunit [Rhodospirillales bacterium]
MRPAFSVIFLTTLIGVGQGLFLALVAGQFYWVIGATKVAEAENFYAFGSLLALVFLAAGLFASFFHLAHPERAWRAASQWRTSWLSREVIALPAVMAIITLYGGLHWLEYRPVLMTFGNMKDLDLTMATGYLGAALVMALFICTGMIYACMKFIQQWASPLTVLNFSLMGSASGFALATAYAGFMESPLIDFFAGGAILLAIAALLGRLTSLWRNKSIKFLSSLQSAVGMHHRNVRQLTRGFTASSFNLKEFFHPGSPTLVPTLTRAYVLLAFVLPLMLMIFGWNQGSMILFSLTFLIQYAGLLIERWVFFAEASHPQNLYYQKVA